MTDAMKLPATKAELLAFMQDQWNGFTRASDALPDEVWLSAVDDHGWSIRDHAGHVVLWTRSEIPLLTDGIPIAQTAGIPDAVWNSTDDNAVNEWFRATLRDRSPADIRAERDRVFPMLLEAVSAIPDDVLLGPARSIGLEDSDRSLLTVMSENYGLHFDDHRAQIEALGRAGAPS